MNIENIWYISAVEKFKLNFKVYMIKITSSSEILVNRSLIFMDHDIS
jgi:hypothetical protein